MQQMESELKTFKYSYLKDKQEWKKNTLESMANNITHINQAYYLSRWEHFTQRYLDKP